MDSNESKSVPLSTLFLTRNWYYRKRVSLSIFKCVWLISKRSIIPFLGINRLLHSLNISVPTLSTGQTAPLDLSFDSEFPKTLYIESSLQFISSISLEIRLWLCDLVNPNTSNLSKERNINFLSSRSPRFLSSCAFSRPIQTRDHNYCTLNMLTSEDLQRITFFYFP